MVTNGNDLGNLGQKKAEKYFCQCCDYYTSYESKWTRHIKTKKHNDNQMVSDGNDLGNLGQKKAETDKNTKLQCECGKEYAHKSGLSRHKHTCTYEPASLSPTQNQLVAQSVDIANVLKLVDKVSELVEKLAEKDKQISDLIPRIGNNNNNSHNSHNTNNTNNIILHLNTNYPNAIPIQELCMKIKQLPNCVTHNPRLLAHTIAELLGHQTDDEKTIRAIKDTMYVKHIDAGFKADEEAVVFEIVKKDTEKNQLSKAAQQNPNMLIREKDSKEYPEMVLGITKDFTSAEIKQMKKHVIKTLGNDTSVL